MVKALNCIASYGYSRPIQKNEKLRSSGENALASWTASDPVARSATRNRRRRLALGDASRAASLRLLRLPFSCLAHDRTEAQQRNPR